ncbi:MAG TPA: choice-of-anchor tandem repeat GloVer-containing protein [Candidatus Baltobacteraceae bacterium]|jgi:uncharacterized repeat protein (TIGR03803 family)|nr:choice-of-anchor tandem repeat GloVer-containing protein [Candidatus Baltobacteraceae bacterium]
MKGLRLVLSLGFGLTLLAGCGGSQPPIGAPGVMPQAPAIVHPAQPIVSSTQNSSLSYKVLHSFGGSGDGSVPTAGLMNVKGMLYGTTFSGGGSGDGTVFSITPSGTETVLHSFGGSRDGTHPYAGLINVKGTLYGTTSEGLGSGGTGSVFSITQSGTEKVLHAFGGTSCDGSVPYAGLLNVKGTLYGTTYYGGAHTIGIVYSITPSGTETVLYSFCGFNCYDGLEPEAGLINVEGTLYGTTSGGGAIGYGTVYKITRGGKESVLHSFGYADGAYPYASLIDVKGTLYGTTLSGPSYTCRNYMYLEGCGTVFSITPSGTETVLHSFTGGSEDGAYPYGGLLSVNGTLYGTTEVGGAYGYGTIFKITRRGKETVLHSFAGGSGDGANPYAGLLKVKSGFYGTTAGGGANNDGTVFWFRL